MKTPKSKLNAFTEMHKMVVDSIQIFSSSKEGAGAEDIIPILVYIYAKTNLKNLVSTIK